MYKINQLIDNGYLTETRTKVSAPGPRLHDPTCLVGVPRLLLAVVEEANGIDNIQCLFDHLCYHGYGVWLRGVSQPNGKLVQPRSYSGSDTYTIDLGEKNRHQT